MMRARPHFQLRMYRPQMNQQQISLPQSLSAVIHRKQSQLLGHLSNGTATSGADYTAAGGTLTFNPGDTSQDIYDVPILADTVDEENETFTVTLSSPTNAVVSTTAGTATMTITDDDASPNSFIRRFDSGRNCWC